MRTPDWTYIERHAGGEVRSQVFSSTDALDQIDVIERYPQAAAELRQTLQRWRLAVEEEKVSAAELALDPEELRVLEGLGYLDRR